MEEIINNSDKETKQTKGQNDVLQIHKFNNYHL